MSTTGRLQDALYNLLWDMEVSQAGEIRDGLLKKAGMTFEQVSALIDPIVDTAISIIGPFWRVQLDEARTQLDSLLQAAESVVHTGVDTDDVNFLDALARLDTAIQQVKGKG